MSNVESAQDIRARLADVRPGEGEVATDREANPDWNEQAVEERNTGNVTPYSRRRLSPAEIREERRAERAMRRAKLHNEARVAQDTLVGFQAPDAKEYRSYIRGLMTQFRATERLMGNQREAVFALQGTAMSAQRSLIIGLRQLERAMEWMQRLEGSNYTGDALDEQVERLEDFMESAISRRDWGLMSCRACEVVWDRVSGDDAEPILQDWLTAVRRVQDSEDRRMQAQDSERSHTVRTRLSGMMLRAGLEQDLIKQEEANEADG